MTVGYRFCGSCNPHINTAGLLKRLQKVDTKNRYVYWEQGGFDTLLIISGCPRDCTTRPPFGGKIITVAGQSMDGLYVPESELIDKILNKLK